METGPQGQMLGLQVVADFIDRLEKGKIILGVNAKWMSAVFVLVGQSQKCLRKVERKGLVYDANEGVFMSFKDPSLSL